VRHPPGPLPRNLAASVHRGQASCAHARRGTGPPLDRGLSYSVPARPPVSAGLQPGPRGGSHTARSRADRRFHGPSNAMCPGQPVARRPNLTARVGPGPLPAPGLNHVHVRALAASLAGSWAEHACTSVKRGVDRCPEPVPAEDSSAQCCGLPACTARRPCSCPGLGQTRRMACPRIPARGRRAVHHGRRGRRVSCGADCPTAA